MKIRKYGCYAQKAENFTEILQQIITLLSAGMRFHFLLSLIRTLQIFFKKEQIQLLYPDESRPGLILSQLITFYFKMKSGDLILIPSQSSKRLFIGKLGDIVTDIKHEESEEEYAKCEYIHKRSVEWIKDISPNVDVYLNKALRSHQAITDVSEYSGVFFRNVFPYYIDRDSLHLTFKKQTDSNYSVWDSIKLQSSVVEIFQLVSKLYNISDNSETYIIKTAVGSQGIIEFIVQNFNDSNIVAILVLLTALGLGGNVSKDSDGKISFSIGVTGIIDKINSLVNDHKNRQMIDAEIKIKEAEARKIDAETEKIQSETKSDGNSISMRYHRMDHIFAHTGFSEHFRCFQAMFFRVEFKVNVMEQSYDSPVFCVITVAQFLCVPFHDCFHSQRMLDMERIFVVFF